MKDRNMFYLELDTPDRSNIRDPIPNEEVEKYINLDDKDVTIINLNVSKQILSKYNFIIAQVIFDNKNYNSHYGPHMKFFVNNVPSISKMTDILFRDWVNTDLYKTCNNGLLFEYDKNNYVVKLKN